MSDIARVYPNGKELAIGGQDVCKVAVNGKETGKVSVNGSEGAKGGQDITR